MPARAQNSPWWPALGSSRHRVPSALPWATAGGRGAQEAQTGLGGTCSDRRGGAWGPSGCGVHGAAGLPLHGACCAETKPAPSPRGCGLSPAPCGRRQTTRWGLWCQMPWPSHSGQLLGPRTVGHWRCLPCPRQCFHRHGLGFHLSRCLRQMRQGRRPGGGGRGSWDGFSPAARPCAPTRVRPGPAAASFLFPHLPSYPGTHVHSGSVVTATTVVPPPQLDPAAQGGPSRPASARCPGCRRRSEAWGRG